MDDPKDITNTLSNILDSHGYGFQYAVLAAAERLFKPGDGSPWHHPVAEFPVEVKNYDYHIDIILEHYRRPLIMVGECKRANPALRNWCFLRAPFKEASSLSEYVFAEALNRSPPKGKWTSPYNSGSGLSRVSISDAPCPRRSP